MTPADLERELDQHSASLRALAAALLGSGADAEDAVQETWRLALQRPPREPGPMGGWLHHVLHQVARRLRRGRSRRAQREQRAAQLEAVPGPDAQAMHRESLRAVVEAVLALDEPYRTTIWERFFEARPPSEMACRSGLPLATVKSRLQRGLSMLRARLDSQRADWRSAIACALGLDGAPAPAAAVAITGVMLMGSGVKLAIGCTAAIAVAATLVLVGGRASPQGDGSQSPVASVQAESADALPAPARERVELPAPAPGLLASDVVRVRGRCVAASDRRPIAGCQVELTCPKSGQEPRKSTATTTEDGRFEVALAPWSAEGAEFYLQLIAEQRAPRTTTWRLLEPGGSVDLGDIAMSEGAVVVGRVVDEAGSPVAEASVQLRNLPLPIVPGTGAMDQGDGCSDANGEFRFNINVPIGTWPLSAGKAGLRLVTPDQLTVSAGRGVEPLLIVLRHQPSIEGVVVDESGAPCRGVGIGPVLDRDGRRPAARTGKDGRFALYAIDDDTQPVKLTVTDPGPCESTWHDERLWAWGTKDVRIELRRALSVELLVVERDTGKAVTNFAVRCQSEAGRKAGNGSPLRLDGDHPQGRVLVDRVWRGRNTLTVLPKDPALLPNPELTFEVDDARASALRIEIERMQPSSVCVIDAAGVPIKGVRVEVIAKGSEPLRLKDDVMPPGVMSIGTYRFHEGRSSASTDALGNAGVLFPNSGDLALRITDDAHIGKIVFPASLVVGQTLTITMSDGGSISGEVRAHGLDVHLLFVRLLRADGADVLSNARRQGAVHVDGTFAIRGLEADRYRVWLCYLIAVNGDTSRQSGEMRLPIDIPDAVVETGHACSLTIDATSLTPATLRGRITIDGSPPALARVELIEDRHWAFGQFTPAADGTFEAAGIIPGTYHLQLITGDVRVMDGNRILHEDALTLAPGQSLVHDFAFVHRRLSIQIVQADGTTPAARLQVCCEGAGLELTINADQDGRFVLDPAPSGPIRLLNARERGALIGTVEIPAGATEHEVKVTLPPSAKK